MDTDAKMVSERRTHCSTRVCLSRPALSFSCSKQWFATVATLRCILFHRKHSDNVAMHHVRPLAVTRAAKSFVFWPARLLRPDARVRRHA
jgi:hypothetical protein